MKLIINNNNFTDIGTVVFYSKDDISSKKYNKVQYKSNSSLLYNRDFSEYNFSYDIVKEKFNDKFKVDYLGDKSNDLFKDNSNSLEKIESIMFPTFSNQDLNEIPDKYFGTTLINNQVYVLFKADKNIKRLELYKGFIYKNNESGESDFIDTDTLYSTGYTPTEIPYFTIVLGESDEDIQDNDLVKLRELEEEVNYDKMIWLLITSNNEVKEINLSYKSWIDNINPNRNMNKYLIRNDEYWSTTDSINIIDPIEDTDNDIIIDSNSGTLLGTKTIEDSNLIIFNKLKDRVNKYKYTEGQIYPNYFPYTIYNKGDKVYYGNEIWESISDNNFNSNPSFSRKWILSDVINSARSIQIVVSVLPIDGGICDPIGIVSIPSLDNIVQFKITPNPGYELNSLLPCLIDEKDVIPLSSEDYDYSVPTNKVIIYNWKNILYKNKLIFNLKYVGSKLVFFSKLNNSIIGYSEWESSFNESNFKIESIETLNVDDTIISIENNPYVNPDGELGVSTNKKIKLTIPELISYTISTVSCEWKGSIDEESLPTAIIPEVIDYKTIITIPKSQFTIGTLIFNLEPKKVSATIVTFEGFEISNNSIKVNSGNSVTFKFIDSEYVLLPDGSTQLADNLDKVVLTDNQGNFAEIGRFSSNGSPVVFGYSSVYLTRVEQPIGSINYGEYTLKISNLYFNTDIKILKV